VLSTEYLQRDCRALKLDAFERYLFVLAFESTNFYDSVAEKSCDPLRAGAVSIRLRVWTSAPQRFAAYLNWRN